MSTCQDKKTQYNVEKMNLNPKIYYFVLLVEYVEDIYMLNMYNDIGTLI